VHRLVTLTGAGGIGKTRLALAAARRLLPQFVEGV
jgi:predicted ATPase